MRETIDEPRDFRDELLEIFCYIIIGLIICAALVTGALAAVDLGVAYAFS